MRGELGASRGAPCRWVCAHKVTLQRCSANLMREVAIVDGDPRPSAAALAPPRGDLLRRTPKTVAQKHARRTRGGLICM
eukprot:3910232-Pleurochrysis_carterae.AAC.1